MSTAYPQLPPDELHLLYILLDSNLPTGGFVSSSGLESYVKHGFLGLPSFSSTLSTTISTSNNTSASISNKQAEFTAVKNTRDVIRGVTDFAEAEVAHYASTTGCFVRDTWTIVTRFLSASTTSNPTADGGELQKILEKIEELDEYHESALLSHVARRASKAQGIAMLTLFGRGLTRPVGFELPDIDVHVRGERGDGDMVDENTDVEGLEREKKSKDLIDAYKLLVRKGRVSGHLSICWGIITAALGLSLERSLHLYLFLHARSLLSTAVRMNIIGPYASSQMLLHPFKDIIDRETALLNDEAVTTGLSFLSSTTPDVSARTKSSKQPEPESILEVEPVDNDAGCRKKGFWDWTKEADLGPATTWPLGEVLMARHDMQHSRIFNS